MLARINPLRREDLAGTALCVLREDVDPDGWLRLELTFQDLRHAAWAIWQLGTEAEALAPQVLRSVLFERAASIAAVYREDLLLSSTGTGDDI